jgi:hypothetical protein
MKSLFLAEALWAECTYHFNAINHAASLVLIRF